MPVRIYVDVISWNQDSLACPCHMSPSPIVYNHINPMHGRSRTWFITLINDLWRNLPLHLKKSLSGWFKTPFSWFTYTCYINMYIYIYFRQFGRYIPTIWELQNMCDVMLHPMFTFVWQFHTYSIWWGSNCHVYCLNNANDMYHGNVCLYLHDDKIYTKLTNTYRHISLFFYHWNIVCTCIHTIQTLKGLSGLLTQSMSFYSIWIYLVSPLP